MKCRGTWGLASTNYTFYCISKARDISEFSSCYPEQTFAADISVEGSLSCWQCSGEFICGMVSLSEGRQQHGSTSSAGRTTNGKKRILLERRKEDRGEKTQKQIKKKRGCLVTV